MSDRSEQALRERLELAKKATPKGERTLWTVDPAGRGYLCIRDAFNEHLLTIEDSADMATARHIAANHPDVVCADLEEILALRAEVERLRAETKALKNSAFEFGVVFSTKVNEMRAREDWLVKQVAIQSNVYGEKPYCPMPGEHKCKMRQGCDLCGANLNARAECWRKAAEMATQENLGNSEESREDKSA